MAVSLADVSSYFFAPPAARPATETPLGGAAGRGPRLDREGGGGGANVAPAAAASPGGGRPPPSLGRGRALARGGRRGKEPGFRWGSSRHFWAKPSTPGRSRRAWPWRPERLVRGGQGRRETRD